MPTDNETRKKNRLRQYNQILKKGSPVDFPCDHCSSHGALCVMAPRNRNCAECTRRGRKCERRLHSEAEWDSVLKNEAKIAEELALAEKQQMDLMMKIIRLRKQQKFLSERSGRMLGHDSDVMAQLDEEDPPSTEDLAELDRLADAEDARILAATSENPTLTQMIATADPASSSFWDGLDVSLLGDPSGSNGTVGPAGGSPSGSR